MRQCELGLGPPGGICAKDGISDFQTLVNHKGAYPNWSRLVANTLTITMRGYFSFALASSKSPGILIFI